MRLHLAQAALCSYACIGPDFLLCTPQGPQLGAHATCVRSSRTATCRLACGSRRAAGGVQGLPGRARQLQVQQQEEEAAALEEIRQQAAAAWPASLTTLARARAVLRDVEAEQAAAELEFAYVQRVREAWRSRYNRMLCSYHPPGA